MTHAFSAALTARATTGLPALIPTITLGDPNLATCRDLMTALAQNHAPALDLHLPFSDPCADSVALQSASHRALHAGLKIAAALDLIADFKAQFPQMPIMLSLYVNNAMAFGLEHFLTRAASVGVNALLFTDVSHAMVAPQGGPFDFKALCAQHGLELVLLAPDNQSRSELQAICADSAASLVLPVHGGAASAATLRLCHELKTPSLVPLAAGTADELSAVLSLGLPQAVTTGDLVANCIERGQDGAAVVAAVVTAYQALCTALCARKAA